MLSKGVFQLYNNAVCLNAILAMLQTIYRSTKRVRSQSALQWYCAFKHAYKYYLLVQNNSIIVTFAVSSYGIVVKAVLHIDIRVADCIVVIHLTRQTPICKMWFQNERQ